MKKEVELYLHIPFCVKKCNYCDFLSFAAGRETQTAYVRALCREIKKWEGFADSRVSSIFIGGGTPSVLPEKELGQIMDTIKSKMEKQDIEHAEITIECNPGTAGEDKLRFYRAAGINRISFGLQSASNEELKKLGRIHTWETFLESYEQARNAGFSNINIDLMSALPGQSTQSWQETLHKVLKLEPEHISAYSLIIEEGTPFYNAYAEADRKRAEDEPQTLLPTEEEERKMYEDTARILAEYGYHRYEISNYAKEGKECRHNCGYWTRTPYKGFGLGAASLLDHSRLKNTECLEKYLETEDPVTELQQLSVTDEMEETMILGLRMMQGVSKERFREKYGVSMKQIYGNVIEKYRGLGLLEETDSHVLLTENGIPVSNVIFSEFLLSE